MNLKLITTMALLASFPAACGKVPPSCIARDYSFVTDDDIRLSLDQNGGFALSLASERVGGVFSYDAEAGSISFDVEGDKLSDDGVAKYLQAAKMNRKMSGIVGAFADDDRTSFPVTRDLRARVIIWAETNDYFFRSDTSCR